MRPSIFFFPDCSPESFQLARKQKQAEESKTDAAPSANCDEATTSDFTDIPLSLPYQEPEEEKRGPVHTPETTAQPSDKPSEKQRTASSQTLSTSLSTKTLQSTLASQDTEDLTNSKGEDGGVATTGTELKAAAQTTELGQDSQSWNQPCISFQLQVSNAPSAPVLYPSLPTLEESSVIHLSEEAVKNTAKGPAVLALPEQEASPPSLQPLESVAELSRYKLYPELPKTAPEIQVISPTKKRHSSKIMAMVIFR